MLPETMRDAARREMPRLGAEEKLRAQRLAFACGLGCAYVLLSAEIARHDGIAVRVSAHTWLESVEKALLGAGPWPSSMVALPRVPSPLHGALVAFAETARAHAAFVQAQRELEARLRDVLPRRGALSVVRVDKPAVEHDRTVHPLSGQGQVKP